MTHATITFIGAGNMASSLVGGLIADDYPAKKIWVTDPDQAKLMQLQQQYQINISNNNQQAAELADILVLAVKPQIMKEVILPLAPILQSRETLVISIAAGIPINALQRWLGELAIVRCMPNTPALIGASATALYANNWVNQQQKNQAEAILRAVGISLWVTNEQQLDIVTALSGSGPAYFLLVMESLIAAAVQLGLSEQTAHLLTLQTAMGSAKMALTSTDKPEQLRQRVTSPGGTTERAIKVLEEQQIHAIFADAITAATQRAKELAVDLSSFNLFSDVGEC